MRTSLFAFAVDLHDEGVEPVLANVRERAGIDDLTLAVAYHAARDVLPHNPVGRVRFLEPGRVFFRPDRSLWRGVRLQPQASELCADTDPLEEARAAAARRGMGVNAWAVFLHSDRLGFEHPECAPRTALGDRLLTDLCPAHPDVRDYAVALTADVAGRGVRSLRAESLHFHGFRHGAHHERVFVAIDPLAERLLDLCFCPSCEEAARAAGVDVAAVRRLAAAEAERALAGRPGTDGGAELALEDVQALAGGELGRFLAVRARVVSDLAEAVTAAARIRGVPVVFIEHAGGLKGYADGRPRGAPAAACAWRLGVDLPALAGTVNAVEVLGYARGSRRLARELEAYRAAGIGPRLALALRIMHPDCTGPRNLAAKVAVARRAGVAELDLYHYGLAPLDCLDWVRTALAGRAR